VNSKNAPELDRPVSRPATAQHKPPYLLVFISLAVLTGLEVGASYLPENVRIPILAILATSKVLLVLLFFMHLKFDHKVFAFPVAAGLVLAIPIILAISLAMPALVPLFK
jgi:cytochrome c oxidase subunit 4